MSQELSLPARLRLATLRLSRQLRQQKVGDITQSQLSALTSVAKAGGLSLGELAAIERVAPPSMTRIATRLEDNGLLARNVDPEDRRVSRVEITDAGLALLNETRQRRDAYMAEMLQRLSDEETELLQRALPLLERLAEPKSKPLSTGK